MQHGVLVLYEANLPMNIFALSVIKRNNLRISYIPSQTQKYSNLKELDDWSKWAIEIDGRLYYSQFKSYEEWKNYYK